MSKLLADVVLITFILDDGMVLTRVVSADEQDEQVRRLIRMGIPRHRIRCLRPPAGEN